MTHLTLVILGDIGRIFPDEIKKLIGCRIPVAFPTIFSYQVRRIQGVFN
jgi:hypothetical protein